MNESRARFRLLAFHNVAQCYAARYEHGFPPSLAQLAAPPEGKPSDCRASNLFPAKEFLEATGYYFHYIPGPPLEPPADGCPRGVIGYFLLARPIEHGETGYRSFFLDQSGALRSTREDRFATVKDGKVKQLPGDLGSASWCPEKQNWRP
jgi:hypothetical protein